MKRPYLISYSLFILLTRYLPSERLNALFLGDRESGATRRTPRIGALLAFSLALSVTLSVGVDRCLAEARVLVGQVLASDSCQLQPTSWSGNCSSVVVPVSGELSLRRRGDRHWVLLKLDRDGNFSGRIDPGVYRVRLLEPRVRELSVKRASFRIAPKILTVRKINAQTAAASQTAVFLVTHRTRGVPLAIGISDGYHK